MTETTAQAVATSPAIQNHPLNDPSYWLEHDQFDAPSDVDIKRCQQEINAIFGVTRNNEPILRLVWNGDRTNWQEWYVSWDSQGLPNKPIMRRPHVRYRTYFHEVTGVPERDTFPPRWLILARIEPEQLPNFKNESFVFDPAIGKQKQVRPDTVPNPYWRVHAVVAEHGNYCCAEAQKNRSNCFGKYAPPQAIYDILGMEAKAVEGERISPFAQVTADTISAMDAQWNGYNLEVAQLKAEREIYLENPAALIGAHGMAAIEGNRKRAEEVVNDYFDRKLQNLKENTENL